MYKGVLTSQTHHPCHPPQKLVPEPDLDSIACHRARRTCSDRSAARARAPDRRLYPRWVAPRPRFTRTRASPLGSALCARSSSPSAAPRRTWRVLTWGLSLGSALVMKCCRAKVGASLLLRACAPRGWSPSGTPRPRPVAYCRDTPPALCRDPPRPPSTTEPHRAPSQSHGAHSRIETPWDLPCLAASYHDSLHVFI